jgi:hypothetical protein
MKRLLFLLAFPFLLLPILLLSVIQWLGQPWRIEIQRTP